MPTTGRFKGDLLKLYIAPDPETPVYALVACSTSETLNQETAMIEAFCKADGNQYNAVPGRITSTLDLEGLIIYDNDVNVEEFQGYVDNQTKIALRWTTAVSGDPKWESNAYITSFSQTGSVDEIATYSVSFQLVEGITFGTVS